MVTPILNRNVKFMMMSSDFLFIRHKYNICVVTNQSGIGRGYYTEKEMHEFNSEINKIIRLKTKHRGIDHFFLSSSSL